MNKKPALFYAFYFINEANKNKKAITNKKLQKLLYYVQAWHLVFYDEPLFKNRIEAWVHGPAIRSVYQHFKSYGYQPIQEDIKEDIFKNSISKNEKDLLDEVWNLYGKHDAFYLERLTHNEDPWIEAREGIESCESSSIEITVDSMKIYYNKLLEDAKNKKNS